LKFNSEALEELSRYAWPGNIRELQHTVEKAVILSESLTIKPDDLMLKVSSINFIDNSLKTLEDMEKLMIEQAIQTHKGNLTVVSQQLGVTRQTLYNKIKKYGL
jgi:DNA-binding NtrC family response regulator